MRLGPYLLGPNDSPENGIYCGDAKKLARAIPGESVGLIYTDPPYSRKFEHVFRGMGEYAPHILKAGGSLITLCGHYQVPMVIESLQELDWHWIGWVESAQKATLFGYRIVCGGKPLLWFSKGNVQIDYGFWWDTKKATGKDKRFHSWGQPAGYAIRDIALLTSEASIILDPFCGGGTIPAVCKMLGRQWLAFEIDPDTAEQARERVRNTQPPLFVLEPEQTTLPETFAAGKNR